MRYHKRVEVPNTKAPSEMSGASQPQQEKAVEAQKHHPRAENQPGRNQVEI